MDDKALLGSFPYSLAARGLASDTIHNYRYHLRLLSESLDGRPLASVTRGDIEAHLARKMAGGWKASTAAYALRAVSAMTRWLVEEGVLTDDPAARVRTPRIVESPVTVATEKDLQALLRTCPASGALAYVGRRDRAILSVLAATGMRRTEVASMRREDLDLDARTVLVPKSKTGRVRVVPFDDRAAHALARWLPFP